MRRVILLICTLVMTGTAAARDSVEWVTEHFEPYYIANGTLAGKDIADRINHALMKELPDEVQASLAASIPFPKRLGQPEEFAALAAHIVANGHLNGEVIRLDGALRMAPR